MAMCVRGKTKATYKRHRFNAVGECKACGEHKVFARKRAVRLVVDSTGRAVAAHVLKAGL